MFQYERVKALRKEKHWSQNEMAEIAGVDARQISRYENGKIQPSIDVLVKMANAFEVSADYLLKKEGARSTNDLPKGLVDRIAELETLNTDDLELLYRVIDAFLAKNKFQKLAKAYK